MRSEREPPQIQYYRLSNKIQVLSVPQCVLTVLTEINRSTSCRRLLIWILFLLLLLLLFVMAAGSCSSLVCRHLLILLFNRNAV